MRRRTLIAVRRRDRNPYNWNDHERRRVSSDELDPENTIYMDIKQGRVVIQMFPDLAPLAVERIKTARAAGVLRQHTVPPRYRRLHGAGRRSDRDRNGRQQTAGSAGRIHDQAALPARHLRHGAHRQSGQREQPVLHHVRARRRIWMANIPSGARSFRGWSTSIRSSAAAAAAERSAIRTASFTFVSPRT